MFSTNYSLSVSETINAPANTVWELMNTFEKQQIWSPRMVQERDAKTWLEWVDGTEWAISFREWERIGAWHQINLTIAPHQHIHSKLVFTKPRKTVSSTQIELNEKAWQTIVTRKLQGKLPFFLFWMKPMMISMISKDFKAGLIMLKDLTEKGKLETSTNYSWEVFAERLFGFWITNTAHQNDMPKVMWADYSTLMQFAKENNIQLLWWFSLYPKTDLKTGIFNFVSCMMVNPSVKESITLPENMEWHAVPWWKSLKVTHNWDYRYIGNSWSALYGSAMHLKKKINKKQPAYELYLTDPRTTSNPAEWVTELYLPLR